MLLSRIRPEIPPSLDCILLLITPPYALSPSSDWLARTSVHQGRWNGFNVGDNCPIQFQDSCSFSRRWTTEAELQRLFRQDRREIPTNGWKSLAVVLEQARERGNESQEIVSLIVSTEPLRSCRIQGGHGLECFPDDALWCIVARVDTLDEDAI
jgi:hypothetical protein